MANVEKVSASLTPERAAMMREVVEAGEYASASEVMREALRDWKHRRAQRAKEIEELGRLWDAGMNSGSAIDGEEAFARIRQKLDARLPGVRLNELSASAACRGGHRSHCPLYHPMTILRRSNAGPTISTAAVSGFGEMPGIGAARPEVRPDLRKLLHRQLPILYRKINDGAEIVRVVPGARQREGLF